MPGLCAILRLLFAEMWRSFYDPKTTGLHVPEQFAQKGDDVPDEVAAIAARLLRNRHSVDMEDLPRS
jgi:hypothetical protein